MKEPFFIGLAGGTASGKSTLAKRLLETAPSGTTSVILVDSYYRRQDHVPLAERARVNYDHPDSLEFALLIEHVLQLKAGLTAQIPIYDYSTHTRSASVHELKPAPIIIVEGILSLHPVELRNHYKLKLFVEAPAEVRLRRRLERDIRERGRTEESVIKQWKDTVQPMHEQYCEPSSKYADRIYSGLDLGPDVVAQLWGRIEEASGLTGR